MLARRLFRLVRAYQQINDDQAALIERYEGLIADCRRYEAELIERIVFLQAAVVDDQRAIRNIAVEAIEALEEGEDLIPALHQLVEFTNASIANLEEHLDVTSVSDL